MNNSRAHQERARWCTYHIGAIYTGKIFRAERILARLHLAVSGRKRAAFGSTGFRSRTKRGSYFIVRHLLSETQRHRAAVWVPMISPSRGGDVTVYVCHKSTELAHSFLFCSCVCFCLYGPFNCISFHKFSRQLSAFSLCSSSLISAFIGPFDCIMSL